MSMVNGLLLGRQPVAEATRGDLPEFGNGRTASTDQIFEMFSYLNGSARKLTVERLPELTRGRVFY